MAEGLQKVGWAAGGFYGGDRCYGMWLGSAEGCTMDLGSGMGGDNGNMPSNRGIVLSDTKLMRAQG